jgi:hypothetical protein
MNRREYVDQILIQDADSSNVIYDDDFDAVGEIISDDDSDL